jgi:hypothetical protein
MGKSVSHGPVCLSGVSASERAESAWRMNCMIVGLHPDCAGMDTPPTTRLFLKRASGCFQNVGKNVLTLEGSTVKTDMCK